MWSKTKVCLLVPPVGFTRLCCALLAVLAACIVAPKQRLVEPVAEVTHDTTALESMPKIPKAWSGANDSLWQNYRQLQSQLHPNLLESEVFVDATGALAYLRGLFRVAAPNHSVYLYILPDGRMVQSVEPELLASTAAPTQRYEAERLASWGKFTIDSALSIASRPLEKRYALVLSISFDVSVERALLQLDAQASFSEDKTVAEATLSLQDAVQISQLPQVFKVRLKSTAQ
jgi:hypothetical protein